ncbi:MAG: SAM hydroxide adenosyltransferase, partial [Candidatus Aenigmatarchaeota archaeon]
VSKGEKLCYMGSGNLLEIAKNRGRLIDELKVSKKDELKIMVTPIE